LLGDVFPPPPNWFLGCLGDKYRRAENVLTEGQGAPLPGHPITCQACSVAPNGTTASAALEDKRVPLPPREATQ
jgi:hypothetical protein